MKFTPIKTPSLLKRVFPSMVWSVSTKEKIIYLTFDDGPTPDITDWTLNLLKNYNAQATFFCIGKNVEENPETYKRIVEDGHGIGNHTHNHLKGWRTSTKDYIENINTASHLIKSNLFRPPYGRITPQQAKVITKKRFRIIMWTILSLDWDNTVTKEKCATNVIKNASAGDIIVFHDSVKASRNMKYALPKVLENFSNKGYVFKRIPELVQ